MNNQYLQLEEQELRFIDRQLKFITGKQKLEKEDYDRMRRVFRYGTAGYLLKFDDKPIARVRKENGNIVISYTIK